MREEGLAPARPRPRPYASYAGEEGRAPAPNLLLLDAACDLHGFSAARPGEALVTDVTEFRLPDEGLRTISWTPCGSGREVRSLVQRSRPEGRLKL